MALNSPSKNCVAQCTFGLVAGLVKVTMVPTGTRMWVGAIAFTAVDSVAPTTPVAERVRARNTVFGGVKVAPSTGLPETGRRTTGGVGVAACASVPPILNAHRLSPRSEEHTSELQSQSNLVCRLLLEKKKQILASRSSASASLSVVATPSRTTSPRPILTAISPFTLT